MALYVASDVPILAPSWSEGCPGFHVQPLSESDNAVRIQFSKPYVVYVGAHTGCSCGFTYGQIEPTSDEEAEQERLSKQSVEALRAFLHEGLGSVPELELFSCWEGDQTAAPLVRLRVTPDHFAGGSFDLPEKAFFRIRAAVEQGDAADGAQLRSRTAPEPRS
jgi:hypothetical protein